MANGGNYNGPEVRRTASEKYKHLVANSTFDMIKICLQKKNCNFAIKNIFKFGLKLNFNKFY